MHAGVYVCVCWVDEMDSSHTAGGPCTPRARLVCSSFSSRQEERKKQQEEEEREEKEREKEAEEELGEGGTGEERKKQEEEREEGDNHGNHGYLTDQHGDDKEKLY